MTGWHKMTCRTMALALALGVNGCRDHESSASDPTPGSDTRSHSSAHDPHDGAPASDTKPCAEEVGSECGSDCASPEEAWCAQCGTLYVDEACQCRPRDCGAIPACDAPGPAKKGDFCGAYWWCDRACEEGLLCVLRADPCVDPGDWRRVCQPPEEVSPQRLSGRCAHSCSNHLPDFVPRSLPGWAADELSRLLTCDDNADCTERANGYCAWVEHSQVPMTRCEYACETDRDCGDNAVCDCGSDVGRCVPSTCDTARCGNSACVRFDDPSVCTDGYLGAGVYYGCTTAADACTTSDDCAAGEVCSAYDATHRIGSRHCQKRQLCGI